MSSNAHFTHGFGYVSVGDGPEVGAKNYNPDSRFQQALYNNIVLGTSSWASQTNSFGTGLRALSSTTYLRPGNLRYTKPDELLVVGAPETASLRVLMSSQYDQYYWVSTSNGFDTRSLRLSFTSPTFTSSSQPHVFSRVSVMYWGDLSGVTNSSTGSAGLPTTHWYGATLSTVDIPGTSIGTLWKHPTGRAAWFNEVGIVALSQGNVEIAGPFDPSESLLQHMGYQIYYTKSGGTGRPGNAANALLTAPVSGSSGTVSAPGTFVDGASQGAFLSAWAAGASGGSVLISGTASAGASTSLTDSSKAWTTDQYRDKLVQITSGTGSGQFRWIASNTATALRVSVAWTTAPDATSAYRIVEPSSYFLRINSGAAKGTYMIVSVTDANTLVVDAPAINTPFSSASSLTWEIVTGPIGEYFYRRRAYLTGSSTNAGLYPDNGNAISLGELQHEVFSLQTDSNASSNSIIHDRGACWWAVANNGSVPLMRWVHLSPQAFEPMHTTGKISGLATWPYQSSYVRDIAIDDQNKIWIVGDPLSGSVRNGRVSTLRVDPYPAGNAATPALVSSFSGDMSAVATASNPLGSNDIRGVVCDDSKAYVANTRVWLLPGTADSLNGISYTDDYGTTWKRLHPLHSRTGTATVSGTSVTGSGTLFTTEFAVGDWIRFSDDLRSYEVAAIASNTSMTLATAHATGVSGSAIRRGVFASANLATTPLWNTPTSDTTAVGVMKTAADYDSNGNLYWLSADASNVVRWNQSTGNPSVLTIANIQSPVNITSGHLCSLTVQRVPTVNGQDAHPLHNSIWIGTRTQGLVRIDPLFDGTHTRYHKTLSNSWPTTGTLPAYGGSADPNIPRIVINPLTGDAMVYVKYMTTGGYQQEYPFHFSVGMSSAYLGKISDFGVPWCMALPRLNSNLYWSTLSPLLCAGYDDIGLGSRACINPSRVVRSSSDSFDWSCGGFSGERWLCKRWNGSEWDFGPLNETSSSIDFERILSPAGPHVDVPVNVGTGVRRMHPDWQMLDEDTKLRIRFVDTNIQSVAQSQQFLVDETTTFVCYVGQGKDNAQTAQWGVDAFTQPTFTRFQTETPKLAKNMWTQDGGIEGGYSLSATSTVDYTPPFSRGVSVPAGHSPGGGTPYPNLIETRLNTGPWQQYSAVLRIKPDFELSSDGRIYGAVSGSQQKFTSTSYTFTSADIGKSIIIEGANGATTDVDNGQAVIVSIDPADSKSVITDKTFAASRTSLRWKLMNIPPVSYAVMAYDYAYAAYVMSRVQFTLYSSADRGVTWQQQKYVDTIQNKTANADIRLYQDSGVDFNNYNLFRIGWDPTGTTACPVIFDLRSLPENVRRRQYWKIRAYCTPADGSYARCHGVLLLDEDFQFMGVPGNCQLDDALDPSFAAATVYSAAIRSFNGVGMSGVDTGLGTGYTDTLTFSGNFYAQSGSNNASLSGSNFSCAGASFVPQDIGKAIRISGSATAGNNGFAVITAYVNATTVTTDKVFTAESNTFSWAVLAFSSGDTLRVLDSAFVETTLNGVSLSDSTFLILDVPSSSTLTISTASFPLAATNKSFQIEKYAGLSDATLGNWQGSQNPNPAYDVQNRWSYAVNGALAWSSAHEFTLLQEGTSTAVSAADDDGDGRTDTVVISATLASTVAVGDSLMLTNATNGRRVYEIKSIAANTPSAGSTTVTVTYDEIFPGQTFSWQALRRKNLTFTYPRVLVTTK